MEQWNDDVKYNSFGYGTHKLSKNLIIYYTQKNIKSSYNNKFRIFAPTWNDEFKLSNYHT